MRYLRGTTSRGITYGPNGSSEIEGYADADFAGDLNSRQSTSGYVFMLGNGAISWMSKRQATITLSTTEAEYISACAAAQEAIYLRRLAIDLHHEVTNATVLYQDNQGAIAIEKDFISNRRLKHIDIKVHFIQEHLANRNILCYVGYACRLPYKTSWTPHK